MKKLPQVSIVGRPNVGKSSLFNRILKRRVAVVSDREGVTRDRHYQNTMWDDKDFNLVDTGGFLLDSEVDEMAEYVRAQIKHAVSESDLILFMVDGRAQISDLDMQFAKIIHRWGKKVLLVANKNERPEDRQNIWEYINLGFGDAFAISAATGYGVGDLLSEITSRIEKVNLEDVDVDGIRKLAILGRPNAGKSTLLNKLLNSERLITSEVAGTTRDSIDCELTFENNKYIITDTAGLRKKARVSDDVEYYSNMRSVESIRRSDVCILMLDANRGMETQDYRIVQQIRNNNKGLVILFNKWDELEGKSHKSFDEFRISIRDRDPMLAYVPMLSISALNGMRVNKVMNEVEAVYCNCHRVLGREKLTELFKHAAESNPHPSRETKIVRMDRACQIMINPPVVMIETTQPKLVDESWQRFFKKVLYENFELNGAHVKINFDRHLKLRTDEELIEHGGIE